MIEKPIIGRRLQSATLAIDEQGNVVTDVALDSYYDEVVGVQFVEIDPSDVVDYNIGIEAGGRRVIDPINAKALQCDRSVAVSERSHPTGFSAKEQTQVVTQVNTVPTATLKIQVIFHLVKYGEC